MNHEPHLKVHKPHWYGEKPHLVWCCADHKKEFGWLDYEKYDE